MPHPPKPPLIQLIGISRVYGHGQATVRALDGVDLEIERGDFVAIMGPSGSGKSTAMNVIGCLDTPTSGDYRFDGVSITGLTRNQRALVRLGLHPDPAGFVSGDEIDAFGAVGLELHVIKF